MPVGRFGRRKQAPDFRDYLARTSLVAPKVLPQRHLFHRGPVLDQGQTPRCVAFAWTDFLTCGPIGNKLAKDPDPQKVYDLAQELDEFADTPPGDGTSVRGGAKALTQLGYLNGYAFAESVEEIANAIWSGATPVVMGTSWLEGMDDTEKFAGHDFIRATGEELGGHAYLAYGVDRNVSCPDGTKGAVRLQNSWGVQWGNNGGMWISLGDLATLLHSDGEACIAAEARK